jgi:hypothetical protein
MNIAPIRIPAVALLLLAMAGRADALSDDFSAALSSDWSTPQAVEPGASVTAPLADDDALDGQVLELLFPGDTSPDDSGPGFATELQTAAVHGFGTYQARMRTPKASHSTGLVAGFFTYFNDGTDHDMDGVVDNHEIDFEILAAEPTAIYMTVWTEYQEVAGVETFHKVTRKVDLHTGRVWDTPPGGEGSYDIVETTPLPWKARKYRASRAYYDYRFVWSAGSVEYSIDLGDGEGFRTLWTLSGAADETIPSIPAPLFFNTWHNATHWKSGKAAREPSRDASFRVDSMSIN